MSDVMNEMYEHEAARFRLGAGLRCGMHDCERPAVVGAAEPDPDYPGLWLLLPLCEDCHRRLGEAGAASAAHDTIQLANP